VKPDIFMDDFERTVWADAHYAAIGRALVFATRFDAGCKTLNIMISVKNKKALLNTEDDIQSFVNRLFKLHLAEHIKTIAGDKKKLKTILDKARLARNEIAHEITLGFDRCIDNLPKKAVQNMMKRLKKLIRSLAEGDRAISLISSIVTHECPPNPKFISEYPQLIEKWVTDMKEI
jgi:hypothetical protein